MADMYHYRRRHSPAFPDSRIDNPYISLSEKCALCRLMLHGRRYRDPFADKRHEVIYGCLETLRVQAWRPSVDLLVRYLAECRLLDRAGGEGYVRSIFRGLP